MTSDKVFQAGKCVMFCAQFFLIFMFMVSVAPAQTTAFTYQGKLSDSGTPVSGTYEMQFKLFDNPNAGQGTQQGVTITNPSVPVSGGLFTVQLDFGSAVFASGTVLYLEVSLRPAGSMGGYTSLAPRQMVTSTPYAVQSLNATNAVNATTATNATQLGGVAASQYVITTDTRLADDRNPLPNSSNYIQNAVTQQAASNFNISGNGTAGGTLSANTVNATVAYNLSGSRILGATGGSFFAGFGAGAANPTGLYNAFFGNFAGQNTTTGGNNSFFGTSAGVNNTNASNNSFFGSSAGAFNTTGSNNSFFGGAAGLSTTTGDGNTFVGIVAGQNNTTGNNNVFIGILAGQVNTTGGNNTLIGANADVSANNLIFATAIGAGAVVTASNTIVLGRNNDFVVVPGLLTIPNLAVAGSTQLCRNSFDRIGSCSSSLRYKTDVQSFTGGLDVLRHLRPITFTWKDAGLRDVGLVAEEVERVEPLLVTYNKDGQVEGVKYDRINVVLVNAVKEQQTEIEQLRQQVKLQQQQFEALKKLVCQTNPQTGICKAKE